MSSASGEAGILHPRLRSLLNKLFSKDRADYLTFGEIEKEAEHLSFSSSISQLLRELNNELNSCIYIPSIEEKEEKEEKDWIIYPTT